MGKASFSSDSPGPVQEKLNDTATVLLSRGDFAASHPTSTAEPKLALLCCLLAVFLSLKCQDLHFPSQEHYRRALTWGSFISWK